MATPSSERLGEVKEGWAVRAEAAYGGDAATATEPELAPPRPPGPPSLRRTSTDVTQMPPRVGPPSLRMAQGLDPVSFVNAGDKDGVPIYEGRSFADEMAGFENNPSVEKAKPGAATCSECKQPLHGWHKDGGVMKPPCRCAPTPEDYTPCPFDPRMYGSDADNRVRAVTPIGVLDMVYHWMLRNREYVTTEGKLDPLWQEVQWVLWTNCGYAEYRPEVWQ